MILSPPIVFRMRFLSSLMCSSHFSLLSIQTPNAFIFFAVLRMMPSSNSTSIKSCYPFLEAVLHTAFKRSHLFDTSWRYPPLYTGQHKRCFKVNPRSFKDFTQSWLSLIMKMGNKSKVKQLKSMFSKESAFPWNIDKVPLHLCWDPNTSFCVL